MKKALMMASVASMIDQFNKDNIKILQDMGFEVTIACNFNHGNTTSDERLAAFREEMEENGVGVLNIPVPRSLSKIGDFFRSIRILRKNMKENRFQLMHCQSPIGGVVARLAARPFLKKGLRVIYYAHGFHFFSGADKINWLLYYHVEKICSYFTDCLITLNREDYKRAKKKFKAKRVVYMPGVGIRLDEFRIKNLDRRMKCQELSLPTDKKIVLSIGELSVRKNVVVTLEAFARVNPKDAILVFCGLGPKREELDIMIQKYRLKDKVFFLGYRMDIPEICNISDLFIFPSKQEGLPAALMQAMAAGLPVIASDIRGNRDLIENKKGGFLYAPSDVKGYMEGMKMLLGNKELSGKMGRVNQEVIKKYSIERVNTKMRNMYFSVIRQIR